MRPLGTPAELERRRRRAVALVEQGYGTREVAELFDVSPGAVSQWHTAYRTHGEAGLASKTPPPSPRKLAPAHYPALLRLLRQGATAHGWKANLWTLARVRDLIRRHFQVDYSVAQVCRLLRELRWSPQKPQPRPRQQHHAAVPGFRHQTWPALKKKPGPKAAPSA